MNEFLLVAGIASTAVSVVSGAPHSPGELCQNHMIDTDIDPHTPGMGSVAASSIDTCCSVCSSPEWFSKGCRFYTLSKGRCWFKQTNSTVVHSPGKMSGQALAQAP